MNEKNKRLFAAVMTFSLGVTFGVIVTLYYEVFGKPVLPKPKIVKHNVTMRYVSDDEVGAWQLEKWAKASE